MTSHDDLRQHTTAASPPDCSRSGAELGWREAEFTFKGAVERSLRLVANLSAYVRHAAARGCEHLGAELKPPTCEIGDRGVRNVTSKPLRQDGTRGADLFRE